MQKRRIMTLCILLAYAVPYVFLAMIGDYQLFSMWPYILAALAMGALGWYCGKTKRIPVALVGNLLSTAVSCLLVSCFATENWNYFFKAFPANIRTVQFAAIMLVVQAIPWWIRAVTKE